MIKVPPYAGIVDPDNAGRGGMRVADATALLHRLAYTKQRLAISAAAYLPSTPEWEVKCALALHAWLDAEHAAVLYSRIAEMREPPPSAADVPDAVLEAALDEPLAAATTSARLGSLYAGVRPLVEEAVATYLSLTNELCDQPSVRLLHAMTRDEEPITRWRNRLDLDEEANEWGTHVRSWIAAAGGITGLDQRHASPAARHRRPYVVDILPRRDERFRGLYDVSTPADVIYLDEARPPDERNAALLFKRLREMDVPEVIAGIVAERWIEARNSGGRGPAWPYFTAMLRQMWDEARHAMLGQALMEAHGIEWTSLPVNVTFSWKLARFCSPVERHILLYAIEQSLMPRDRGKPYEHRVAAASGDRLSALFHDYDWADEVLHVDIARRCLKPELPGGLAEARTRADELWTKVAAALDRDPLPVDGSETAFADWWPRFARAVLGRDVAPAPGTHVKDWRPLSG
ncbi:MAG TPA: hypothetical protein VG106_14575 [Vicinamibacterales bacterium]|nr:hypothetical protein [Vicinamibacterales bacterium]